MFSTSAGGGLSARTDSGGVNATTALPAALLGSPHRFRVEWTATGVTYSVDGTVVATHAVPISAPMRPLVSDFAVGAGAVAIDWLRMSPYAASSTFLSRVFDAAAAVDWQALSWTTELPAGTSAVFSARHGDSLSPDATWTAFAIVPGSGSSPGGRSRYFQYRVDLSSTDPMATPVVEQVSVLYTSVPPNRPPSAADESFTTPQNTPLVAAAPGVLANDADPDGDRLQAILVSSSAHGAVTLQADGAFTYSPAAGFAGTDSFIYKANDERDDSNLASVSITVVAANRSPVGSADSYSTNEDTRLNVAAPGVLANDSDPLGRALTAVLVRGPLHGTLSKFASNGSLTYTPELNFNGADSLVYRVKSGADQSADTTVTITVTAVNDAPVASGDIYRNDQFQTLTVPGPGILANTPTLRAVR